MTDGEDALCALEAGADFFGLIFYPRSPRFVTLERAEEILDFLRKKGYAEPPAIGVFVDEERVRVLEIARVLNLFAVQLHGAESSEYCSALPWRKIKAIRVKTPESLNAIGKYDVWAYLCDAYHPDMYGGTGKRIDASLIAPYVSRHRIFLAGGLTPENVFDALKQIRPFGVDVSSGVEVLPGKKDPEKVKAFIQAVKNLTTKKEL